MSCSFVRLGGKRYKDPWFECDLARFEGDPHVYITRPIHARTIQSLQASLGLFGYNQCINAKKTMRARVVGLV